MAERTSSAIWAKWMLVFSIIIIITGFCFAFVYTYFLPQVIEPFYAEMTGTRTVELTDGEIKFHNLLSGVIGGTMMGWGVMLLFLAYRLLKKPEEWIWTAIAASLITWYACDTLASVIAGSMLNIALNTTFLIVSLPPVIANRNSVIKGLKDLKSGY
ncbi:MAG: hypothetical protein ACFFD4_25700 [Candidatus Odinarchaeota archaeon]